MECHLRKEDLEKNSKNNKKKLLEINNDSRSEDVTKIVKR